MRHWSKIIEDYARQLDDAQEGKLSRHQVVLPEVDALRTSDEPIPHICLLTEFLPFDVVTRIITGKRAYPTHQIILDQDQETYRIVERGDRRGL